MDTRRRSTIPASRTALAVLACVGFGAAVALVGAGSVGPDRHGGGAAADTAVTTVAVLVGAVALGGTAFVARRTGRPPAAAEGAPMSRPPIFLQPIVAPLLATLLLLLFSALVLGPCLSKQRSGSAPPLGTRGPTTSAAPAADDAEQGDDTPNWSVVTGLVLGAAGLALAVVAARNRQRPEVETSAPDLDDDIARSLADLDGLDQDPDHRRVVIRTYARMERALARIGIRRQPWETSQEYLRRSLAALGGGAGAAGDLTDLFELARFSSHPVDAAMRARAADALRAIRDDVAAGRASTGSVA